MSELLTGHCDQVLHEARNGCMALKGLTIKMRNDLKAQAGVRLDLTEINAEIERIADALRRCCFRNVMRCGERPASSASTASASGRWQR